MKANKLKEHLQALLEFFWKSVGNIIEKFLTFQQKFALKPAQYKHKKNLMRAIATILMTFVFLQLISQLQFKNFLDTESMAFSRVEKFANFYSSSKPTINEQGFAQYGDLYGVTAWNEFVSTSLNLQAGKAFDELTLIQYQLESSDIWPIFSRKIEAKRQTIKYFAIVNEYLNAVQNCPDAKCFENATKMLNKVNGEVTELALKRAIPRIDVLKLKDKLNDY